MKTSAKWYLLILVLIAFSIKAQNNFAPYMINSAGGSGNVGANYFDYTIGEHSIVFGGTGCDSVYTGFQHLAVDTLRFKKPLLSASGPTVLCSNTVVTLMAPSSTSYSWSNGATTQNINVTVSATYQATLTNSCGNQLVTNSINVAAFPVPTPSLCLVTVDSLGNNNEIYWDKNQFAGADTFIVLRETNSLVYTPIARISKNLDGSYVDTNRIAGYSSSGYYTGDPNFSYYNYKLQMRDTCGKLSGLSDSHTSIKINDQQNGNFDWNDYEINGVSLPSASYSLWRQNVITGTSTLVGSTSGNSASDLQYNALAQAGNVKWFVSTIGFPCSANLGSKGGKPAGAKPTKTKSNNTNERQFPIGIKLQLPDHTSILIYPNPANDRLYIQLNTDAKDLTYKLEDVSGRLIATQKISNGDQDIKTDTLPAGLYIINFYQGNSFLVAKKIVLEH